MRANFTPIKVMFVDDVKLKANGGLVRDVIKSAPSLRSPLVYVRDENIVPIIDLMSEVKEDLIEGRTTVEEIHRAFMGLDKGTFQLHKPEMIREREDVEAEERRRKADGRINEPGCDCTKRKRVFDTGPYYTHLGAGATKEEIREGLEERMSLTRDNIRIETAIHVPGEGKSSQGCPIAKYVSEENQILYKGVTYNCV